MSSSLARRGITTALTVFAAAIFCSFWFGSAAASAAPAVTGKASFTVGAGKAGAVLVKQKVKVRKVGAASVARKGKRFVARLPVRNLVHHKRTDASLKGGFLFRKGKRAVKVRNLKVIVRRNGKIKVAGVIQRVGGKGSGRRSVRNLFNVTGKAKIATKGSVAEGSSTRLRIKHGRVSLTAGTARKVRRQLGLKRNPRGKIATLKLNAVRTDDPVVDPYHEKCGVPVARVVRNAWPDAAPLPTLSNALAANSAEGIVWGFSTSFRGYVFGTMSGNAPPPDLGDQALQALDGASRSGFPLNPTRGFSFPVTDGDYAENSADPADDQAILNGSGTALMCNSKHGFWVSISDPTVVIDGADSRIVADVSQNLYGPQLDGPWQQSQRIDLARLDLTGITPDSGPGTVSWASVPVTLSPEAAPFATYGAGKELDPITVTLETQE